MRRWLEVSAEVPPAAADALAAWLVDRGAPGVVEENAADHLRLLAHFEAADDDDEGELVDALRGFLVAIDEFFPGAAASRVAVASVDEEDWAEGWKRSFPPLEVGRRLRIRTPWSARDDSGRHDVEILPAMAFGTGHHGSTFGCLLALEELMEREGALSPVLDVGTGSGVLAIAAARLGASAVVAVDVDPVAVEAAVENVRRNGLEGIVRPKLGSLETAAGRYQLIVANLHTNLLSELVAGFGDHAEPRGWLIVSGLLEADRGDVRDAALAAGWEPNGERGLDGWTTLTFRRRRQTPR
jgi:ribosomal protein L11 methyltransferase